MAFDPNFPVPLENVAAEYIKTALKSEGLLQIPEVDNFAMIYPRSLARGILAFLLDHAEITVYDISNPNDIIGKGRITDYVNNLDAWLNG